MKEKFNLKNFIKQFFQNYIIEYFDRQLMYRDGEVYVCDKKNKEIIINTLNNLNVDLKQKKIIIKINKQFNHIEDDECEQWVTLYTYRKNKYLEYFDYRLKLQNIYEFRCQLLNQFQREETVSTPQRIDGEPYYVDKKFMVDYYNKEQEFIFFIYFIDQEHDNKKMLKEYTNAIKEFTHLKNSHGGL